jgi:BMFP domain-containing protein YqiC
LVESLNPVVVVRDLLQVQSRMLAVARASQNALGSTSHALESEADQQEREQEASEHWRSLTGCEQN